MPNLLLWPGATQVLPCGWAVWVLGFNCLKVLTARPLFEEQANKVRRRWCLRDG